ncbi:probable BOI-related E3 ubiquitin-protein ligase 3 [Ziziphus jujuba]|uniref:Probable BOI-related E3 ubiquitin-protein ligase 3 n=1 Tax=Ziziphus jujuba TaxID=326968 RepID=A0A6P4A286_ZIZJJ|nr:probable BOI-related E3 ubiquitin-protein ligase 3 [Ziziphus jujuba]
MPILFISSYLFLFLSLPIFFQLSPKYQNSKPKNKKEKKFLIQKITELATNITKKKNSMAVEARHLNLFPPQLIGNREMMNTFEGNTNIYNSSSNQMGYGVVPLSGTITADTLLPAYNNVFNDSNSFPPKTTTTTTAMKSDSGLTYNFPTLSRKRSRDSSSIDPFLSPYQTATKNCGASFSFLGEDISLQIQQHQFDIDHLISHHMEKVRLEIEEKRKRQARKILEAIELGMMKRLRAKEEEIEKMGKLNWALEERVKSLCVENQIWRDLAQTNEATANALRTNLEHVLAQVKEDHHRTQEEETQAAAAGLAALMDDAQSGCGSSGGEVNGDDGEVNATMDGCGWRLIGDRKGEEEGTSGRGGNKSKSNKMMVDNNSFNGGTTGNSNKRWCRNCGKEESCVLILPCRHLCLCTVCGSSLHTCPICKTPKNVSLHVNMS